MGSIVSLAGRILRPGPPVSHDPSIVVTTAPAAAPAATAVSPTTATTDGGTVADSASAQRVQDLQNRDHGVLGLIGTSLRGLLDPGNNVPPRKTLLGE